MNTVELCDGSIVDQSTHLSDDSIGDLVRSEHFDGSFFMSMNIGTQRAILRYLVNVGFLKFNEAAQLECAVNEPSYGINLPDKIIRISRMRMSEVMGDDVVSAQSESGENLQNQTKESSSKDEVLKYDEARWQRFVAGVAGCTDGGFEHIVQQFILSRRTEYVMPVWKLAKKRNKRVKHNVASYIFRSVDVSDEEKEIIWDEIKHEMNEECHISIGTYAGYVFLTGIERMQREFIDIYGNVYALKSLVGSAVPAVRSLILNAQMDRFEHTEIDNEFLVTAGDRDLAELLGHKTLTEEDLVGVRNRVVKLLDAIADADIEKREYLMSVAFYVRHWGYVGRVLDTDLMWYMDFLKKIFNTTGCPDHIKLKIAQKAADQLNERSYVRFDQVEGVSLEMMALLSPQDADKLAGKIVDYVFGERSGLTDYSKYSFYDRSELRSSYLEYLLTLVSAVHSLELKEKIGRVILASSPMNDVLVRLEKEVPSLRAEIVQKADGAEEAVKHLLEHNAV